jgi:hypothetical protein
MHTFLWAACSGFGGWLLALVWVQRMGFTRSRQLDAGTSQALNVVAGVVLPEPDDPRWRPAKCRNPKQCQITVFHRFKMFGVDVHLGCDGCWESICVGNALLMQHTDANQKDPYARAVLRAYIEKHAQRAIEGPEPKRLTS